MYPSFEQDFFNTVNKHSYLLHDGRARNFEEAILWHGGEAAKLQTSFTQLNKADREAVLRFFGKFVGQA